MTITVFRRAVWPLVGLLSVALTLFNYAPVGDVWSLSFVGFGLVGAFVAWKAPDHVTGRLMVGLAAVSALPDFNALRQVTEAAQWIGVAMPLLMGLFLLTFPEGRIAQRWWRTASFVALGVTAAGLVVATNTGDEGPYVVVPLMLYLVGAAVDLVFRYRRATGDQKAQMKYVVFATIASASLIIFPFGVPEVLADILVVMGFTLIPLAVGGAILRYRLYDIDRIISRTLTYALVVIALGAGFAVLTWLPSLLIGGANNTQTPTSAPPVVVAASTLAAAALFNPLRKRTQHAVNRRFNRSAYEAESISRQFAAQLTQSLTTEELTKALDQAVNETLHPESIGVWLKEASPIHPVSRQHPITGL